MHVTTYHKLTRALDLVHELFVNLCVDLHINNLVTKNLRFTNGIYPSNQQTDNGMCSGCLMC